MARQRFGFLLRGGYFFVFSLFIVRPSDEALSSWPVFAKDLGIRLGIVIGFLLVTPRFLGVNSVDALRITPAQPHHEEDATVLVSEDEVSYETRPGARMKLKHWLILGLCIGAFFASLLRDLYRLDHLSFSLRAISGTLSSVCDAFCVAVFLGWILLALTAPLGDPGATGRAKLLLLLRRSVFPILVCVTVWAAWWIQPSIWEIIARSAMILLNMGIFILMFLPKPSSNQPELLHVVPRHPVEAEKA